MKFASCTMETPKYLGVFLCAYGAMPLFQPRRPLSRISLRTPTLTPMCRLLLLSILLLPVSLNAQVFKSIDTNQVSVGLEASGIHFMDGQFNSSYWIPKGSGNSTIRFGQFWIGGWNASNELHVAAEISPAVTGDFRPGPVNNDAITEPQYNQVWRVSRGEILSHQANYNQPGYIAPPDILDWPGNGDTLKGEAWQLAPYDDLNANGIYEPNFGETPCIRSDEAVYAIYSDQLDEAAGPGIGTDLIVEFHTMLYVHTAVPGHDYLDSTVFNHTVVHARGFQDFTDVYLGHYIDFDIGQFYDDYLGTDVPRDLFYAFNGNGVDADYGVDPPAQGVHVLNDPTGQGLHATMFYTDLTTATGLPLFDEHYYQSLTARWKDSTHLVFNNNNGHVGGGPGPDCNFMYSAGTDPNHPTPSWEEWSAAQNPGQRRAMGSIGPFDLNAGDRLEFDYVYLFGRKQFFGPAGGVQRIQFLSDQVDSWWAQQYYTCSSQTIGIDNPKPDYRVFPNPTSNRVHLQFDRPVQGRWQLITIDGRTLQEGLLDDVQLQVDLQAASPGLYIWSLKSDQWTITERILKQ